MDYSSYIASLTGIPNGQVEATLHLLRDGNTIPFISRYRKEVTGNLDEVQVRDISVLYEKALALEERRQTILASIESQGFLTPELAEKIHHANTKAELEDLYLPYKPKQRTRATDAIEKGLQGLADLIRKQITGPYSLEKLAAPYLNEKVLTVEDAFSGARDIVAAEISNHAEVRGEIRAKALKWAILQAEKIPDAQDEKAVFQDYYVFEGRVAGLRPHQVLAINRGEAEKILRVKCLIPERDWRPVVENFFRADLRSILKPQLELAILDAAERLLLPAIENDLRRTLTEVAEAHAIRVFAENVRGLLIQPPIKGHTVLGIDPGFRTGCKVAVVDQTGKLLDTQTIYPHPPQDRKTEAAALLGRLIEKYRVTLIAIGNGTASRETEQLVASVIHLYPDAHYLIVSEAGASVYSASDLARKEMPDLDVSMRGAVSIARRVLDPLAELVKIDPKAIGVGMYQHDLNQKELGKTLEGVVESVVNYVGVDVNTASPALLTYVAGIGPKLAERIVEYRNDNGIFLDRKSLKAVHGLGPKAFEQSAGFLRIRNGINPLDASAIHPESYPVAQAIMKLTGITLKEPVTKRVEALSQLRGRTAPAALARELNVGLPTLQDILDQLTRPGRDPREDLPAPFLRSDVLSMDDLATGMKLKGTVRNVVDFGAFVDIGIKQAGLLHRSQLPAGRVLKVGEIIEVVILRIEKERDRVGLGWPDKG